MAADPTPRPGHGEWRAHILFAALILAATLGIRLFSKLSGVSFGETPQRVMMAMIGGYFVVTGNAIPKVLVPLCGLADDPVGAQVFRRFTGWTWVVAGATLVAAWLLLPVPLARTITLAALPISMLLTVVRRFTLPRAAQPLT